MCLNYLVGFCKIIPMWVLKHHLSNFLILFYKVNEDINILIKINLYVFS